MKIQQNKRKSLIELTTELAYKHDLILHDIIHSYEIIFILLDYQQNLSESEVSVMECYKSFTSTVP